MAPVRTAEAPLSPGFCVISKTRTFSSSARTFVVGAAAKRSVESAKARPAIDTPSITTQWAGVMNVLLFAARKALRPMMVLKLFWVEKGHAGGRLPIGDRG